MIGKYKLDFGTEVCKKIKQFNIFFKKKLF